MGYRVAPAGDYARLGTSNNPASAGGFEGDFYALSMGLNYKPLSRPNLTVRPEMRYDWYEDAQTVLVTIHSTMELPKTNSSTVWM